MAAQLKNDLADMMRLDSKNDVLTRKRTLPIMFILSQCKKTFPVLLDYYDGTITQEEFLKYKTDFLHFIIDSGVIEYVETIRKLYLHKAEQLLNEIPTRSPWNQTFQSLVFAPHRN